MATSDFSKLPRLIRRKGIYLYWQDSEFGTDGKRKLIALGHADDPQALARYHQIEAEYNGPQNTLNWLFTRFESAFLGDMPGNQGLRRVKRLAPKTRYLVPTPGAGDVPHLQPQRPALHSRWV